MTSPERCSPLAVKCVTAGSVLMNAPEGEPEGWLSLGTAPALVLLLEWWLVPFCCEKSCTMGVQATWSHSEHLKDGS